jgi:hypothetical protein
MSNGVEVHAKCAVLRGLMLVCAGTSRENLGLCCCDVKDGEVEVELLWVCPTRPGRRHPIVDALEAERPASLQVL